MKRWSPVSQSSQPGLSEERERGQMTAKQGGPQERSQPSALAMGLLLFMQVWEVLVLRVFLVLPSGHQSLVGRGVSVALLIPDSGQMSWGVSVE